jgi:hypothetical protein
LDCHGATRVELDITNRLHDIYKIAYLLASNVPDDVDAINSFVNVVKPSWVTDSLRDKRALNPRYYNPDPALFMSKVTVFCSEIGGQVEAIHAAVLALGGDTAPVINRTVTHIVTLEPLDTGKTPTAKTILPDW